MGALFFEVCIYLLGLTARPRSRPILYVFLVYGLVFGFLLIKVWAGPLSFLVPALLVIASVAAALQVIAARAAVWRAACLRLDDPHQPPVAGATAAALAPTTTTLRRLGVALDDVRRGRFVDAGELVPRIDRDLLRPDEARLLDAVRALISLGLGDTRKAAQQAAIALPTGSEEINTILGRTILTESWHQPDRLQALRIEWACAGVTTKSTTTLARLHVLACLRIDERLLDRVSAAEARVLSTEARAVGDEALAADLEARARGSSYR